MLLAHLILNSEPPFVRHLHNCSWLKGQGSEAFTTFNPRDTEVCTQVEVRIELSLSYSYFKRSSSRDRWNVVGSRCRDLAPGCSLVGYLPASHRDLQGSHKMCALVQMAFERNWIVARIKRACQRREIRDANQAQIFPCAKLRARVSHQCTSNFWS